MADKKEKVIAFRCTMELGGQYRNKGGSVIFVGKDDPIVDALVEEMYYTEGGKKKVRFGFEEIFNYLPPATPLDVKMEESKRLKELADENNALKQKLDEMNAKNKPAGPPPAGPRVE